MRATLLALLLASCLPDEAGIDRTVIEGTITIPPAQVTDNRTNNAVTSPQGLGPDDATGLTYRSVVISGKVSEWPSGLAEGDPDNFGFSPIADGTFSFSFTFPTEPGAPDPDTADTAAAPVDADVFDLQLVDPATYDAEAGTGILWETSTDGSGGVVAFDYDVVAGTDYVLRVVPVSTDAPTEELSYTLTLSGTPPDDGTILVGAFLGQDPVVAEDPVGGTNATGWTYDAATLTWTAAWKMMWIRQVVAVEDTDTTDLFEPTPEVTEAPSPVYVRAGTITTLNAGPAAGALYTSTSTEVALTGGSVKLDEPLVLDAVAPKVIGQQITETLPDETLAEIDLADYSLIDETLVAQELPMLTGLGYVDIVTGSAVLDPATSGWNGANDSDAYAFTVPETMNVRMTASWPDTAADLDFGIWYPDPEFGTIDLFSSFGDSYCLTGANPEVCESVVTLEPDVTYYLVALGYLGTDEQPYTVELEWVAP